MVMVVDVDIVKDEEDPPFVLIAERLVMFQGFVLIHAYFVHTAIVLSMSLRIVRTC
jgi:hypothetical protein